jgi:predicted GH43/DUF377 family glycosyl hydrolase
MPPSSPVKVYYGAADTAVGLAVTTVGELLEAATESDIPYRFDPVVRLC